MRARAHTQLKRLTGITGHTESDEYHGIAGRTS